MEPLETGRLYTGIVDGYGSEGQGVVRINGAVVFVPGAVRGETLRLRITKVMKSAAVGEIAEIAAASPRRRTPDCPYFGTCGGCVWRHVSYEEELFAKRQRVEDALRRLGGAEITLEAIHGGSRTACRNKSQFPVDGAGQIGFYQAGSHRVIPVQNCLLQSEAANRTAEAVRNWMRRYRVPGYDERTGRGLVRHLYVRTNRAGESLCCVVANGRKLPAEPELAGLILEAVPHTAGILLNTNTCRGNVILGDRYRTIWGRDWLTDTLCGLEFRLSVPSFYQVNPVQAETLYGTALEYAALTGRETVLDLYCGIGTITLCAAKQAGRVLGAELVPQAVRDAEENAVRNGVTNVSFFLADAAETAAKLERDGLRPDGIIVDPPRKGLEASVIASIAAMGPERVVYVSCDPGTLGRDVGRFAEYGYRPVRAAAVDMFPATRHVESVALLTRR